MELISDVIQKSAEVLENKDAVLAEIGNSVVLGADDKASKGLDNVGGITLKNNKKKGSKKKKKSAALRKRKTKKPAAAAIIPKRSYENSTHYTMNNNTRWNYCGGGDANNKYDNDNAKQMRGKLKEVMKKERVKARVLSSKKNVGLSNKENKWWRRDAINAPRYPAGAEGMDRKKSEYSRSFVWPGFTPK